MKVLKEDKYDFVNFSGRLDRDVKQAFELYSLVRN